MISWLQYFGEKVELRWMLVMKSGSTRVRYYCKEKIVVSIYIFYPIVQKNDVAAVDPVRKGMDEQMNVEKKLIWLCGMRPCHSPCKSLWGHVWHGGLPQGVCGMWHGGMPLSHKLF